MKQFTTLHRIPLLLCSFLVVSLSIYSSIFAQTKTGITPGTFSHQPSLLAPAADGTGLQQYYSVTGRYTLSADGIGSNNASMNIRVNKPNAGAKVEKAILISSLTPFNTIDNGCVSIADVPVNWEGTASVSYFTNYWADVTSIVAPKINAFPAGISTLPITECSSGIIDGEALLVIFNDPSTTEKSNIVMLGAENPQGDNFSVTLAKPINPKAPGALLDMGLGIGYSYQLNATNQASQVSVNNQRISSSAGGEDDGEDANGALITVGGIGDSNNNPPDPYADPTTPRSDDELYSILPFINDNTTSLTINTINPSLDDNIFLAYFVTSGAAVVGEGILLSQASDTGHVGDNHTVKATLVNSNGEPITNRSVTFTITSGPNSGNTYSAKTDENGYATYTYTGNGGTGVDSIQACFKNGENVTVCSNSLAFVWIQTNQNTPPHFDYPPTPIDGATINVHPGENVMFTVKAEDADAGDHVQLSVMGLPTGSSTSPSLPASGNPASAKFMWTPGEGDVGTYTVEFTATDDNGKSITTTVIIQVTTVSCNNDNFRPFIYVYPLFTVANQSYHTIYKGYGQQSVNLIAVPRGGSGNLLRYRFKWDNGSRLPFRRVSPNVTTTYYVEITDASGCVARAAITIHVVDVRCGKNNDKVQVCLGMRSLCVDLSRVEALIKGGAKLGSCDMMDHAAPTAQSRMAAPDALKAPLQNTFTAYPNPAVSVIHFKWNVPASGNIKINILDLQGRTLLSQSMTTASQGVNISKLTSGMYMAQLVVDGNPMGLTRFTVSR